MAINFDRTLLLSSDEFLGEGLGIIARKDDRIFRRKDSYQLKKFREYFGIDPKVMAFVWKELLKDRWIFRHYQNKKPQPKHLLWAYYLIHVYDTVSRSSDFAGCDEKTWHKWSWIYVKAIRRLVKKFVSMNVIYLYNYLQLCQLINHIFHCID